MRITLEIELEPFAPASQADIAKYIEFEMGWRGDLPRDTYDRAADSIISGEAA